MADEDNRLKSNRTWIKWTELEDGLSLEYHNNWYKKPGDEEDLKRRIRLIISWNQSRNLQRCQLTGIVGTPRAQCNYQCNLYYVPETRGYRVSGSAGLFPKHSVALAFKPDTHVQELVDELQTTLAAMRHKRRTMNVLQTPAKHMDAYVSSEPLPLPEHQVEQRVDKQRVLGIPAPPVSPEIQRVGVAHHTPLANKPTLARVLQSAARTHLRSTRANTPGALPPTRRVNIIEPPAIIQAPSHSTLHKMKLHPEGQSPTSTHSTAHTNTMVLLPTYPSQVVVTQQQTDQPGHHQPPPSGQNHK
jgi:hypothetical protein